MSEQLLKQILNEMQNIKTEVTGIKTEVASIKTEVALIKTEVASIKREIDGIKQEQEITNERLTNIELKQATIYEQTGHLTEYHTETISRIDRLQTDIEFTYQKTALHDLKINRIELNSNELRQQ